MNSINNFPFSECHLCGQNKKETKIKTFGGKKYHQECLLLVYELYKSEPRGQSEEELKGTREFTKEYIKQFSNLDDLGAFAKMTKFLNNEVDSIIKKQK